MYIFFVCVNWGWVSLPSQGSNAASCGCAVPPGKSGKYRFVESVATDFGQRSDRLLSQKRISALSWRPCRKFEKYLRIFKEIIPRNVTYKKNFQDRYIVRPVSFQKHISAILKVHRYWIVFSRKIQEETNLHNAWKSSLWAAGSLERGAEADRTARGCCMPISGERPRLQAPPHSRHRPRLLSDRTEIPIKENEEACTTQLYTY